MPGDLCACGYETDPAAGYACSECDGSGEGCVGEVCRECDGSGWFVTPEQARAALAQPSPAPTMRAAIDVANDRFEVPVAKWGTDLAGEEERPEVVAWRYGFSGGIVSDKACLDEWKSGGEYQSLMTVAQHERIVASRWERAMDLMGEHVARISEKLERCDALLAARAAQAGQMPQAWLDVQAERRRQVEAEGWTPEHDDAHSHGQMARAAACYALAGSSAPNDGTAALLVSLAWPWDEQWWKPTTTRRDLVKACALGLAEIERLDRAASSEGGPHDA
ncbi:TPA: hypothetical protein ACRNJW_001341 [Pseudomonas aeruginosa]|uniref:hypothetical protein n=1 Tax=Pseudomonas aeruginosa TaxID=287 RepID=UPI001FC90CD0|nr:hypothetical protein [Pseudomonas aeruginosa]